MKKFYLGLGVVAVAGAAFLASSMRGGAVASEPVDMAGLADQELIDLAKGQVYGDPDAPITIMEFGDYQCPACRYFGLSVKSQINLAYIETGQAKLVFHDFPLTAHPHAFLAARAAWCASDEDRYFDYHDALFNSQESWSPQGDASGAFLDLAADLGLNREAFKGCLESDKYADVVSANQQLGLRMGVGGTPTIFVHLGEGGVRRLGGFQFADVQAALESEGE